MATDKDLMFELVRETRTDVARIFEKLDSLPCGKNTEKINNLERCSDRKSSFIMAIPALLLSVLSIILTVKNWK